VEKLARAIAAGNTFAAVADELLAKVTREGRVETTLKKTKWLFDFAEYYGASTGERNLKEARAGRYIFGRTPWRKRAVFQSELMAASLDPAFSSTQC
jgi:hypothetical protein